MENFVNRLQTKCQISLSIILICCFIGLHTAVLSSSPSDTGGGAAVSGERTGRSEVPIDHRAAADPSAEEGSAAARPADRWTDTDIETVRTAIQRDLNDQHLLPRAPYFTHHMAGQPAITDHNPFTSEQIKKVIEDPTAHEGTTGGETENQTVFVINSATDVGSGNSSFHTLPRGDVRTSHVLVLTIYARPTTEGGAGAVSSGASKNVFTDVSRIRYSPRSHISEDTIFSRPDASWIRRRVLVEPGSPIFRDSAESQKREFPAPQWRFEWMYFPWFEEKWYFVPVSIYRGMDVLDNLNKIFPASNPDAWITRLQRLGTEIYRQLRELDFPTRDVKLENMVALWAAGDFHFSIIDTENPSIWTPRYTPKNEHASCSSYHSTFKFFKL